MAKDADMKSRYPEYEKPVFDSKIPPHLIAQLDEKERWMYENMSVLQQKTDWLIEKQMETNDNVRNTDTRLQVVELWKNVLSGKWAVAGALSVIAVTAGLSAIVRLVFEKIFP